MMEPMELPLFSSMEDEVCYLLVPGVEENGIRGVEYQVDWDRSVLNVFLYEEEKEDSQIDGVRIPVMIDQENVKMVQEMTTLYVTDPRKISPGTVGEEDYVHLKEQFEQWKGKRQ